MNNTIAAPIQFPPQQYREVYFDRVYFEEAFLLASPFEDHRLQEIVVQDLYQ